jgi:signal transduction histidine kinase
VLVANLRLLEEEKRRTLTMATVVHELRNPLAAIQAGLGAIELIEKNRSPQTDTILQMATQQVRRLSNIIRDLLALARMEAGKTEWAFAAMDIRMVIKQAVEALGPLAAERNVRVVADLPDSLPMAFGHPDRVTQVVTNLVANGLRFVAAGSGEVVVTARVASGSAAGSVQSEGHFVDLVSRQDLRISEQQHIEVRVGDNGPGISPEDQRQLFHPFSQVGKDKRREEAGSGLGLAICREIVRRHGGRIWVASEPGKGAEFVFTLPMVKSELASA